MTGEQPKRARRRSLAGMAAAANRAIPFKSVLYEPLRKVMPRRLKRRLKPLRVTGIITVAVDETHAFRLQSHGMRLENDLYWRGYGQGWEAMSLRLWRQFAPTATTIIDVGAQTGIYAVAAKCINPDALVVAFEPLPSSFALLEACIALNEFDIVAVNSAISDRSGTATLYDPTSQHGQATIEERPGEPHAEIVTGTVRLDDFARERGIAKIDLIKIDVEGHEPAVIRGLGDLLATSKPTMLVEILSDAAGSAIWDLVGPAGYQAYLLDDVNGTFRQSELKWVSNKKRNYLLSDDDALAGTGLAKLADGSYALPASVGARA